MAAVTQQPNGDVPSFKIVSRLDGVPVVHDSVAFAQGIINSTGLTATLYATACDIASKSYEVATPVLVKTKPILESADGLAVATFDRVSQTIPYPFKTPTQDLVGVKQAKSVYDARVLPFFQHAQPVIQDVLNKTAQINSALGARAHATMQTSQDLSHAMLEQLKQIAAQGNKLPHALIEGVSKTTSDLKTIVLAKDQSIQDKSNQVGAYVIDQVKPIVDEIYNYVLGAKNKAKAEAEKAADKANGAIQQ